MRKGLMILGILTLTLTAAAQIYDVSIGDNFFDPEVITVSPGDRIRWTNDGANTHRSKSINGLWDSGFLDPGDSYTRTFSNAGSFDYHDPQYSTATGTIIVSGAEVELTSWGRIISLYR